MPVKSNYTDPLEKKPSEIKDDKTDFEEQVKEDFNSDLWKVGRINESEIHTPPPGDYRKSSAFSIGD